MDKNKFIHRVAKGWQVRMKTPDGGDHSKWFGDTHFGSNKKALQRAVKYRNSVMKQYNIPLDHSRPQPRQSSSKTTTGIVGISYFNNTWKAHYYNAVEGKQQNKQFSTTKYGECEAFEMACRYRYEKCGKLRVYSGFTFPCKIPVEFVNLGEGEKQDGQRG